MHQQPVPSPDPLARARHLRYDRTGSLRGPQLAVRLAQEAPKVGSLTRPARLRRRPLGSCSRLPAACARLDHGVRDSAHG
eukprot:scaffold3173_cov242-Pinguiococcus_pyrenoidosus.AAC.9